MSFTSRRRDFSAHTPRQLYLATSYFHFLAFLQPAGRECTMRTLYFLSRTFSAAAEIDSFF